MDNVENFVYFTPTHYTLFVKIPFVHSLGLISNKPTSCDSTWLVVEGGGDLRLVTYCFFPCLASLQFPEHFFNGIVLSSEKSRLVEILLV